MEKRIPRADVKDRLAAVVERMNRREADFAVDRQGSDTVELLGCHDLLWRVAGEAIVTGAPSGIPHVTLGPDHGSWFAWLTGATR